MAYWQPYEGVVPISYSKVVKYKIYEEHFQVQAWICFGWVPSWKYDTIFPTFSIHNQIQSNIRKRDGNF
jgi:hypothetical protein